MGDGTEPAVDATACRIFYGVFVIPYFKTRKFRNSVVLKIRISSNKCPINCRDLLFLKILNVNTAKSQVINIY